MKSRTVQALQTQHTQSKLNEIIKYVDDIHARRLIHKKININASTERLDFGSYFLL